MNKELEITEADKGKFRVFSWGILFGITALVAMMIMEVDPPGVPFVVVGWVALVVALEYCYLKAV